VILERGIGISDRVKRALGGAPRGGAFKKHEGNVRETSNSQERVKTKEK